MADITTLLRQAHDGREGGWDRLMERVYRDLKGVAAKQMRREFGEDLAGVTLEPCALVNETYLRLIKQRKRYDNRGQFFAIATRVMKRVLMDYHRKRGADKRFGGQVRVTLSGLGAGAPAADVDTEIPLLLEALERLEQLDARAAEVAQLRLIWGMTIPEIVECLALSRSSVNREWGFARKWLAAEVSGGDSA